MQGTAQGREAGGHAPDKGGGGVLLLGLGGQLVEVHHDEGIALGLHADHAALVGGGGGQDVQVHAGGQDPAVLVVRVVAAQLRAAGGAEQCLRQALKGLGKAGDGGGAAGAGGLGALGAVEAGQFLPKGGVLDARFQADRFHRRFLLIMIHYVKSTSFRRRFPCAAVALAWIFVAKPIAPVYAGDKTGGERRP